MWVPLCVYGWSKKGAYLACLRVLLMAAPTSMPELMVFCKHVYRCTKRKLTECAYAKKVNWIQGSVEQRRFMLQVGPLSGKRTAHLRAFGIQRRPVSVRSMRCTTFKSMTVNASKVLCCLLV